MIKNGFYPALGTPVDEEGILIEKSFEKEIEKMEAAGAAGVLCLGSMGQMAAIRDSEYPKIASACVKMVAGRIPVMVGVMDCSAGRVLDRIKSLSEIPLEGVVATPPYYRARSQPEIISFFTLLAEKSRYPVFIYDLPSVTQSPITQEILKPLMKMDNIRGIKSANKELILDAMEFNEVRDDFYFFYSNLDSFDTAILAGIRKNLDGMFTCTPENSRLMYKDLGNNNEEKISRHLGNIIKLRNIMLKERVLPAYSYAMELLGCPGNYHPDYSCPVSGRLKEEIRECMKQIQEI